MDVVFKGQHAAADEQLQEYARQRIGRLDRYLPTVREAVVEVRREKTRSAQERYVVQVTVNSNGTFLRAEERAAEPRVAVDSAADALGKQIRRLKHKKYRSLRATHQARHLEETAVEAVEEIEDDEEELVAGHVVRVKRFAIKPMTVEEAVEQMELLGHNFFLFFDVDDHRYALLYRRQDGDYGLILPDSGG
jgi:putative sigma-54 modulation protein